MHGIDASQVSKTDLARRYDALRATVRRVRNEAQHAAKLGTSAVLTAAGGAAAGFMSVRTSLAKVPGTEVPSDLALGSALVLGCALDMFDGANDQVACFANGMLAFWAGREAQKMTLAKLGASG